MADTENTTAADDRPYGIYLADGTYLDAGCGLAGYELWIWSNKKAADELVRLFNLMNDPLKTYRVEYRWAFGEPMVYEGYTRLRMIRVELDDKITIGLSKE